MIPDILFTSPKTEEEFSRYYHFRWEQLRAPLDFPPGSERDEHESDAFHACAMKPDHEIIAVGRIHHIDDDHSRIRFMAVAEKYQRLGIGTFLLTMLERYAKTQQRSRIWLHARADVYHFYEVNGYMATGEVETTLPIKHFRVEKILTSSKD